MKAGIRVIGIDDAPFDRKNRKVLVVGVVCRKGNVEGVLSTRISRDGSDSTGKLLEMINGSRFREQLHAIFINSITLGGFNVIDIEMLSKKTGMPVICVTRKKPNKEAAEAALRKLKNYRRKLMLLRKVREIHKFRYYLQIAGIEVEGAKQFIKMFGIEPLRLAHIIAGGVVTGESKGRV